MRSYKYRTIFCCLIIAIGGLSATLLSGCKPSTPSAGNDADSSTEIVAQQAVAGVGKQGQSLRDDQGIAKIVSGPAAALFNFKQKAVLEIQVKQAIDVFKASNGRFPESHQEFMEQCIAPYNIQLPELPTGAVYRFNPEKGQLWVYPQDEVPGD